MIKNPQNAKDLIIGVAIYTSSSIFGPLLILGGAGFFLDKYFISSPKWLIIGVVAAFFVSNILIIKRAGQFTKWFQEKFSIKIDQNNEKKDK